MAYRATGVGGFGFSVNWEKVPGDKEVARRVVTFLEDRRLLFGERHREDELHCVLSATEIRKFPSSMDDICHAPLTFEEACGPGGVGELHRLSRLEVSRASSEPRPELRK